MKKFLVLFLAPALLAGCSSVSNLTPSQEKRNASGMYTVEAKWKSNRQAVRDDSMEPVVLANGQTYPMQRVPLVQDRWEASIPVPPGQDTVRYRYRFNYKVNSLGAPKGDSVISPEYRMQVVEPK